MTSRNGWLRYSPADAFISHRWSPSHQSTARLWWVSVTVTWMVTWSSSDGQYGTFTTTMDSTDNPAIHVGQLRTVLVTPPSR